MKDLIYDPASSFARCCVWDVIINILTHFIPLLDECLSVTDCTSDYITPERVSNGRRISACFWTMPHSREEHCPDNKLSPLLDLLCKLTKMATIRASFTGICIFLCRLLMGMLQKYYDLSASRQSYLTPKSWRKPNTNTDVKRYGSVGVIFQLHRNLTIHPPSFFFTFFLLRLLTFFF